jgi:SAM-dependent methyltransferase
MPSLLSNTLSRELVAGVAAGAAGAVLLQALVARWRAARAAAAAPELSTTSSAHSGAVYETTKALDEYLLFHYGAPAELLPYARGPAVPLAALDFAVRTAELCAAWQRAGSAASTAAAPAAAADLGAAFDVGCATGRSSFELTRLGYSAVVGLDFSHRFVDACKELTRGALPFGMQVEGAVAARGEARAPAGSRPEACTFVQGDACALDVPALRKLTPGARGFALVHAANLLCRLPEPRAFLRTLPALLAPGGLVVFFSPYSWLAQYTPQSKWIGGAAGARSADVLAAEMQALGFERVAQEDVPFLIREHARKFQYGVAHATAWRMKVKA